MVRPRFWAAGSAALGCTDEPIRTEPGRTNLVACPSAQYSISLVTVSLLLLTVTTPRQVLQPPMNGPLF